MLLYADEDFFFPVVEKLRTLGHDMLTAREDGHASEDDPIILARAHSLGRVLLTFNHAGILRGYIVRGRRTRACCLLPKIGITLLSLPVSTPSWQV